MVVKKRLALVDDQMLERSLAKRIVRRVELKFVCGKSEYTGFVTGLDDEWIQICTTYKQKCVWLNRMMISEMEETGRTLRTIAESSSVKNKIEGYMQNLTRAASEYLNEGVQD